MLRLNPVEYLGIETVRAGVPRWHVAMADGRRRAPKCDRILRDGQRCRNASIREARKLIRQSIAASSTCRREFGAGSTTSGGAADKCWRHQTIQF